MSYRMLLVNMFIYSSIVCAMQLASARTSVDQHSSSIISSSGATYLPSFSSLLAWWILSTA